MKQCKYYMTLVCLQPSKFVAGSLDVLKEGRGHREMTKEVVVQARKDVR